ncbi:hypothetical protein [Thauera mechernichensis]
MSRKAEVDEALAHWSELHNAWQKANTPEATEERRQYRNAMRRHYWRNWEFGFPFVATLAFVIALLCGISYINGYPEADLIEAALGALLVTGVQIVYLLAATYPFAAVK